MNELNPSLIDTTVQIRRPVDGGADVLRQFSASFDYHGDRGTEEIGQVHGWIGWSILEEDVADAGDAISFDAAQLGAAAAEIIDTHFDDFIDAALLIDRMYLEPVWRGRRLSGAIINSLMALLRLDLGRRRWFCSPSPRGRRVDRTRTVLSGTRRWLACMRPIG